METIMLLIVMGSVFFVYYDASKHKIGKIQGEKGFFNLSAGAWAIVTLLLWIIAFPAYLIKRGKLIEKAKEKPQEPSNRNLKLGIIGVIGLALVLNLGSFDGGSSLPLDDATALGSAIEEITNEMQKMASKMAIDHKDKQGSPKDVKDLLDKAFSRAGYSYSGTLHKLAEEGMTFTGQSTAVFMLIPLMAKDATGAEPKPEDVYSGQELEDVKTILKIMKAQ